jgi:hypothetical protein
MRAPKNGQMPDFNQSQPPMRKKQSAEDDDSKIYTMKNPIGKNDYFNQKKNDTKEAKSILTFGNDSSKDGDLSSEIIKLIEQVNKQEHFEYEIETFNDVFKKLEKFLLKELGKANPKGEHLS